MSSAQASDGSAADAGTGLPLVTVAIPTLTAGETLAECLRSLNVQTFRSFEVIVVDNSGEGLATCAGSPARMIRNSHNLGFGAAINQAFRASNALYLVTLNDDAQADPHWLEALMTVAEARPKAGMIASRVMLAGTGALDSAGMLMASDGSSKQRGHGAPPAAVEGLRDALLPSGSAAFYRRAMLEEIGLFDESFFLYCEDTDLGLRARWAGWECAYAPDAVVDHRYSHSAGKASPLKAYYVERNRLFLVIKNLPWSMVLGAQFAALARYFWHFVALTEGRGKGAEFHEAGHGFVLLPFLVLRAHIAALWRLPRLLSERRRLRRMHRLSGREFRDLIRRNAISLREVASL